jgi:hypothetical protein
VTQAKPTKLKRKSPTYSIKRKPCRSEVREEAELYGLEAEPTSILAESAAKDKMTLGYDPSYGAKPFTNFSSVTPETDLGTLNLNWQERDLPEAGLALAS